jgi:hypothetical protein
MGKRLGAMDGGGGRVRGLLSSCYRIDSRRKTMEEKREKWLNYLALTTVVLAVCATLATFKAGGNSTRSVLSQNQASDQWAYFQAKSIKGYLYELQHEKLELELAALKRQSPRASFPDMEKKIEEYGKKIAKVIEVDARRFEAVRDDAKIHSQIFGVAVIFLQIAILLSSIAALMKKKVVWIAGLFSGVAGVGYFLNGFFALVK